MEEEARRRELGLDKTISMLDSWYLGDGASDLQRTDGCDRSVNTRIAQQATERYVGKFGLPAAAVSVVWQIVLESNLSDVSILAAWIGVLEFLDALDGAAETAEDRQELLIAHAQDFLARHESAATSQWTVNSFSVPSSQGSIGSTMEIRVEVTGLLIQSANDALTRLLAPGSGRGASLAFRQFSWGEPSGIEPAVAPSSVERSFPELDELQPRGGVSGAPRAA